VEIVRTLSVAPTAPLEARRSLRPLDETLPAKRLDDLRLLISELVTNAVVHSGLGEGGTVLLIVAVLPRTTRVEVVDRGQGFPTVPERWADEHGWGLGIVDLAADRWGVERGTETRVWAELALAG